MKSWTETFTYCKIQQSQQSIGLKNIGKKISHLWSYLLYTTKFRQFGLVLGVRLAAWHSDWSRPLHTLQCQVALCSTLCLRVEPWNSIIEIVLQNIYDFLFDLLTRRRALKFSLLYEGHLNSSQVIFNGINLGRGFYFWSLLPPCGVICPNHCFKNLWTSWHFRQFCEAISRWDFAVQIFWGVISQWDFAVQTFLGQFFMRQCFMRQFFMVRFCDAIFVMWKFYARI